MGYSYLFYQQTAGINYLVFNLLFVLLLLIRNRDLLLKRKWAWALGLCLTSSIGILLTSSSLSIIANCVSLLLLSALSFSIKTSSVFSFIFSIYSLLSSTVWVVIDLVARVAAAKGTMEHSAKNKSYKAIAILAVFVLCLMFFGLYKNANPLFAENTKWINLDFISFSWMVFTLGGFFLVYALFYHKTIDSIEVWENGLSRSNSEFKSEKLKQTETERFGGMLLFIFLNLMLVVLNVGDITTIWFHAALPKGVTHTDFVHNGVGMIILSILIATALIMFLFRKKDEQGKHTKLIKILVYLWIFQNLIMLFSTTIRNQIYIHDFNFTYKRIGVYVWLFLAAVGLVITFIKVMNERSNWFLIKNNFAVWFTVLCLASLPNWDILITRYNLANKPLKDVDLYYLFSLSDSNIPELLAVTKDPDFARVKDKLKNYRGANVYYYDENYMSLLHQKIRHYMRYYNADWQSWDLVDQRNIKTLIK